MDKNIQLQVKPLVSVIIPVYNGEAFIAECIKSAVDQSWPNKEIIVVDDGSSDNSLEIARGFESETVKVISQKNSGAAAARNRGLKEAKGDYIQFLDGDDLLSPDKIAAQITCLNGSLTELAICKTVHFNNGKNYPDGKYSNDWFNADNNDPADFLTKLYAGKETMSGYGGMVTIHAWLVPRPVIEKAGHWNEKLSVDDDGEFFCRVILASDGIKYSDTGINYYRKFNTRESLSAQKSKKGMESAVLATDLKYEHLTARAGNLLVDRIFARHYWWTGVLAYPQYKKLSANCIVKAKKLGYNGEKYVGGPAGHLLTKIFGWKAARLIAYYQQLLKRSWA